MNTKPIYNILLVTLLALVCTPGIVAADQLDEAPVIQLVEDELGQESPPPSDSQNNAPPPPLREGSDNSQPPPPPREGSDNNQPPPPREDEGTQNGQQPPQNRDLGSGQQPPPRESGDTGNGQQPPAPGGTPPQEAIAACNGGVEQDACEFSFNQGTETGVCEVVQEQLACSPQRDPSDSPPENQTGGSSDLQQPGDNNDQTNPGQLAALGGTPPQEAIAACSGGIEQDACEFTSNNGPETGVCEVVQDQLACSPQRDPFEGPPENQSDGPLDAQHPSERDPSDGRPPAENGAAYNIEQAISDHAQEMTISFDALAFLTGDLGADSFFPPGKVADFWGFQYLRDNDPTEMGHNTDFLTQAAFNMLNVLTPEQRSELVTLAEGQVDSIDEYAEMRFVLMDAFRRLLDGDLPAGTSRLDEEAVKDYSADLYRLDGEISFERAQVMGGMLSALDESQQNYLEALVGVGMLDWPDVEEPSDIRGLDRDVKVAVMTYAGDMFSWYLGSVEADVYFCPERQGTYFGSFYLKDAPAMGNPDYTISSNLTGDMGEAMLNTLTPDQAQLLTGLVDIQRPYLLEIVDTRQLVAVDLRKFMAGESADMDAVLAWMEEYGELDGAIIYNFAENFAQVGSSLTREQEAQLMAFREEMLGDMLYPDGAYLYSQPISMPEIPNSDFLFR